MPELVVTRGLPGSGKSTWAKQWVERDRPNRVRINRDDLRKMIDDGVWIDKVTEPRIVSIRDAAILASLNKNRSVVVDDTNLDSGTIKTLKKLAQKVNVRFWVQDFTGVPVEICIDRDINRPKSERVGQDVILTMYKKYLKNPAFSISNETEYGMEPYQKNAVHVPNAVIIDIDGTVARMNGRSPYDYTRVNQDVPNPSVIYLVNTLINQGVRPLFTSGRPDSCRADTLEWLQQWIPAAFRVDYALLMRATGDTRPDWIIKYELFDKHIRYSYNVLMVLDDRNQVVDMWRKIGLTCLQVAEGDF